MAGFLYEQRQIRSDENSKSPILGEYRSDENRQAARGGHAAL